MAHHAGRPQDSTLPLITEIIQANKRSLTGGAPLSTLSKPRPPGSSTWYRQRRGDGGHCPSNSAARGEQDTLRLAVSVQARKGVNKI